ncbi:MAG: lipoprotein-releasing ABC transporter permease subunit [Betaproteobacteria bacterium]
MFKPIELFISLRYTRRKRKSGFISFISVSSILGIMLGVAALIVVLSVMNGFQRELRATILGVVSHVQIVGSSGKLGNWETLRERIADVDSPVKIEGVAPFVSGEALFSRGPTVHGAMIRGVSPDEEITVSDLSRNMVAGEFESLRAGSFRVILGVDLARSLGVAVGEKVLLITPQGQVTPAGVMPRLKQFTVSGVFEMKNYQYDSALALINIEDSQKLFRMRPGEVTGVRLKLSDIDAAPELTSRLNAELPDNVFATDWTRSHATFFRAIQIEKRVMFIILLLIVAVAAFNIVSTLVMVVTDKRADIAILRTLGATQGQILRIFISQGAIIGVTGTILGLALGLLVSMNIDVIVPAIESFFGTQFLAKDVYYIAEIPSEVDPSDVISICVVSFALTILATIYPSVKASRVKPTDALRYE